MGKTILIADDDALLIEVLSGSFIEAGFSILTATNGVDALRIARSRSADILLLDLNLPGLDGFTVCEALRRDRATAGIPIIMLTGLNSQLGRFAGLDSGADDYIMKPVTPEQILSRIAWLWSPSRQWSGSSTWGADKCCGTHHKSI